MALIALLVAALPAVAPADDFEERNIALWALRKGGRVLLQGGSEYVGDPMDLPPGKVRIVGIDMHGTVVPPKELGPLSQLPELREVFLPARVWSPTFDKKSEYADEMFDFLAHSTKLEKFEAGLTTLAYLRLGEAGLQRLAPLTQLKDLRVALVTIKSPKTLAPFVNMEYLDLNDANIMDEMMPGLSGMKKLRRLTMIGTLITDEGLKYIQDLTSLEELDLYGVRITDAGVNYLRKLTNLRRLNLLGAQITDASADVLAGMPQLTELNLYRSRLTNAGLSKLQKLPNLRLLDVRYSGVSEAGVTALRAANPRCRVAFVNKMAAQNLPAADAAPKGSTPKAIAAWVESIGGRVRLRDGQIHSISLARVPFNDKQLGHLRNLATLEALDLEGTDVSDLGLETIAGLPALRDLNLNFTSVSDRNLKSLSRLTRLTRLSLAGTLVEGTALGELAGLAHLDDLDLNSSRLTDAGMPHLSRLAHLRRLALSNTDVSDAGLEPLAAAANLEQLDLRGVDVGDEGLRRIARLGSLRDLNLNHGRFTDKGLAHLKALPKLERLRLVRTRLTDAGVIHLAQIKSLRSLKLDYTKVTDKGIELLASLPLEDLTLDSTDVTDKGAALLAAVTTLKALDLYHTLVSEIGFRQLRTSLPQCNVFWEKESALPTRRHL